MALSAHVHHVVNATFPDILPCTVRNAFGILDCRKKYRYVGLMDKAPRPMATPRCRLCGVENVGRNASVDTSALQRKGSFSVVDI
jgi:hypothetical protein